MKATFEFNLPEDNEELKSFQNGPSANLALFDFSQDVLRKAVKYGYLNGKELNQDQVDMMEEVQELFWAIINERNLDIG